MNEHLEQFRGALPEALKAFGELLVSTLAAVTDPDERKAVLALAADSLHKDVRTQISSAAYAAASGDKLEREKALADAKAAHDAALVALKAEHATALAAAGSGKSDAVESLRREVESLKASKTEAETAHAAALADLGRRVHVEKLASLLASGSGGKHKRLDPAWVDVLLRDPALASRLELAADGSLRVKNAEGTDYLLPKTSLGQSPLEALAEDIAERAPSGAVLTGGDSGGGIAGNGAAGAPGSASILDKYLARNKAAAEKPNVLTGPRLPAAP